MLLQQGPSGHGLLELMLHFDLLRDFWRYALGCHFFSPTFEICLVLFTTAVDWFGEPTKLFNIIDPQTIHSGHFLLGSRCLWEGGSKTVWLGCILFNNTSRLSWEDAKTTKMPSLTKCAQETTLPLEYTKIYLCDINIEPKQSLDISDIFNNSMVHTPSCNSRIFKSIEIWDTGYGKQL